MVVAGDAGIADEVALASIVLFTAAVAALEPGLGMAIRNGGLLAQGGDEGGDTSEDGGAAVFGGVVGRRKIFDGRPWSEEGKQVGREAVGHVSCRLVGRFAGAGEGEVSRAPRAATPLLGLRLRLRLRLPIRGSVRY